MIFLNKEKFTKLKQIHTFYIIGIAKKSHLAIRDDLCHDFKIKSKMEEFC